MYYVYPQIAVGGQIKNYKTTKIKYIITSCGDKSQVVKGILEYQVFLESEQHVQSPKVRMDIGIAKELKKEVTMPGALRPQMRVEKMILKISQGPCNTHL